MAFDEKGCQKTLLAIRRYNFEQSNANNNF
jgi:hypothetical protein